MQLCALGHREICFEQGSCPICMFIETMAIKLNKKESEIDLQQIEIEKLKARNDELQIEIDDMVFT